MPTRGLVEQGELDLDSATDCSQVKSNDTNFNLSPDYLTQDLRSLYSSNLKQFYYYD